MIQENNFFARVAFVVFAHSFNQGTSNARTIALRDVTNTLVSGRFQDVQTFCRAQLVVKAHDFKFDASLVQGTVLLCKKLKAFELVIAHRCHEA